MPWGGGNGGAWGPSPWGDGAAAPPSPPTFASAAITDVAVLGNNLLKVTFNVLMKVDGFLTDPSNYTIYPQGSGQAVSVNRVLSPAGASTLYVLLDVSSFTVGESYIVDIANMFTTKGNTVDTGNSASSFYGRITKLDFFRSTQQKMYSREPGTIVTSVMLAITGEDEKIGGTEGQDE